MLDQSISSLLTYYLTIPIKNNFRLRFTPQVEDVKREPDIIEDEKKTDKKDFFLDVIGMKEEYFWKLACQAQPASVPNSINEIFFREERDQYKGYMIRNVTTHRKYKAGSLHLLSLKELNERIVMKSPPPYGRIVLIHGDVRHYQYLPENKDAVFQVESNCNALNLPTRASNLDTQLLTGYANKETQDLAASVSCAPGLIYRRYYYYYNQRDESPKDLLSDPHRYRQTSTHQLNLLQHTHFLVDRAGYVETESKNSVQPSIPQRKSSEKADLPKRVPKEKVEQRFRYPDILLNAEYEQEFNNVQILFHEHVEVSLGINDKGECVKVGTSKMQVVNQVFVTTINLKDIKNKKEDLKYAQLLVDAAYEGTIKAALLFNKKRVFLSILGGAVSKEDHTQIAYAINKHRGLIRNTGLHVYVNLPDEIIRDEKPEKSNYLDCYKPIDT